MASPKWDSQKHRYRLSTGREFSANLGILGLAPEGDDLYEGYDGGVGYIYSPGEADVMTQEEVDRLSAGWDEGAFTPEERREIAAMMMERWRRWASLRDRSETRGEDSEDG